jgi:hypothetical protein
MRRTAERSNIVARLARSVADPFGAILGTLQVLGALVLTFFLPGYLLVNALYPRRGELDREYDALYRLTLGIVLSIAVTVGWSFFLNAFGVNPDTNIGYVVRENIAAGLLGLSALFFAVGWWRGAYPVLAKVHPSLARTPAPGPSDLLAEEDRDHRVRLKLQELAVRREALRRAITDAERRMRLQSVEAKAHYERKREEARTELKALEVELRRLEEERAAELY